MKTKAILAVILLVAAFFRFYGLNWDQNHHLHPDERFLTMVAGGISWPDSLSQYLDASTSPLNPHNNNFDFYVYGTYPVFLVKYVAESLGRGDYNQLTLVGRATSAFVDVLTLIMVFYIAKTIFKENFPALLATSFYGISVLPVQLSHFFTVDPHLTFFLTLSFLFLVKLTSNSHPQLFSFLLGISYGLALASKISALIFLPLISFGFFGALVKTKKLASLVMQGLLFLSAGFFTLRLAQPYLFDAPDILSFKLNPKVIANWKQLKSFDNPDVWFPPATMWINSPNYLFPLENLLLWGLGLPLGIISVLSVPYVIYSRHRDLLVVLSVLWIIILFGYQGAQFAKPMRYFYPIYPFLAITSGVFVSDVCRKLKSPYWLLTLLYCLILVWPVSFISIYSRPHSRVVASDWLLKNAPPGSFLSCEHWDDCLPLGGPGPFRIMEFPLYLPDTQQKWQDMEQKLAQVDYIVLSSNRLYGSTMTVPKRYPQTIKYYESLFNGSLGFALVAQFTSRPNLPISGINLCIAPPNIIYGKIAKSIQDCPLPGISFIDDYADETFTVYDHPKVLIFKRINHPKPSPSIFFHNL